MPWQPGHFPITLCLSFNKCNLLSSLAFSTDDRDVRAGVGMDSWLLETSSWQYLQATEDGTALNLRPQANDRVQQQSFNIGERGRRQQTAEAGERTVLPWLSPLTKSASNGEQ